MHGPGPINFESKTNRDGVIVKMDWTETDSEIGPTGAGPIDLKQRRTGAGAETDRPE